MDLGFLIIANSIMRTRLPPKKAQDGSGTTFRKVLSDIPFLIYILGSFLVCHSLYTKPSTLSDALTGILGDIRSL